MADISKLAPKILKWEGGFVNDPLDHGGATNKGVTLKTYKLFFGEFKTAEDLKKITDEEFIHILKTGYWDRWKADAIKNQSIADILVDWVWDSGKWGIVIPQRILKVVDDGIVGMGTLFAVNDTDQRLLWNNIFAARMTFLENIVKNNISQGKFLHGWMNRLNDFTFAY